MEENVTTEGRESTLGVREKAAEEGSIMRAQCKIHTGAANVKQHTILRTTQEKATDAPAIQDAEKLESAKAAVVAAVGGIVGSFPYLLTSGQPPLSTLLSTAVVLFSSFLFGVTYRFVPSSNRLIAIVANCNQMRNLGDMDVYLLPNAITCASWGVWLCSFCDKQCDAHPGECECLPFNKCS